MSEAVERRLELARLLGDRYQANPKVAAVIVAGSVGWGWADRYSDIEVDVFWSKPPSDGERREAIESAGGEVIRLYPYEEDEWADEALMGGVKVDVSAFSVETMYRWLADLVERFDTSIDKQFVVAAVQEGIALSGDEVIGSWRARAATYPDGLVEAMLREYLDVEPLWRLGAMLAVRDDVLMLHQILVAAAVRLMNALLALNRQYVPHPNTKWLDRLANGLSIAPRDLASRLRLVLRSDAATSVQEMLALIDDTYVLVEQHAPWIDVAELRPPMRVRGELSF